MAMSDLLKSFAKPIMHTTKYSVYDTSIKQNSPRQQVLPILFAFWQVPCVFPYREILIISKM